MPFALIFIGVTMLVTAANNTHVQLAQQLATDGQAFAKYAVAIGGVGAAGYIPELETLSRYFLTLIIIALVLSNSKTGNGLIGNLQNAINNLSTGSGTATTSVPSVSSSAAASGATFAQRFSAVTQSFDSFFNSTITGTPTGGSAP